VGAPSPTEGLSSTAVWGILDAMGGLRKQEPAA
jgi:hypothetical protein